MTLSDLRPMLAAATERLRRDHSAPGLGRYGDHVWLTVSEDGMTVHAALGREFLREDAPDGDIPAAIERLFDRMPPTAAMIDATLGVRRAEAAR
jgi:hypothetical protein